MKKAESYYSFKTYSLRDKSNQIFFKILDYLF